MADTKGIAYHKGEYVLLSPEEVEDAYPKTTQTIEIEAFVDVDDVPFVYLERPYYTAPINKGERVYALLREALKQTGKAGIARVVIRAKQHLAVLMPCGPALVLNLMRWGNEIRSWDDLPLPSTGAKAASLKEGELKMAKQLDGLLFQVRDIAGVHRVMNALTAHDAPDHHLVAAQGSGSLRRRRVQPA